MGLNRASAGKTDEAQESMSARLHMALEGEKVVVIDKRRLLFG